MGSVNDKGKVLNMKDTEIIANINKLLDYAETQTGSYSFKERKASVVNFSKHIKSIDDVMSFRISDEHSALYYETFYAVFNKGNIKDNYVIKTFDKKFRDFLIFSKVKDKEVTKRDFSRFINGLISAKAEKVIIFHKVFGLEITSAEPVKIGCFTFYNSSAHISYILKAVDYPTLETLLEYHDEFNKHDVWISVELEAVDKEKAYGIACTYFEVFQGICQFVFDIEGYNAYAVCVLNDISPTHDRCYIFSQASAMDKAESGFRRVYNINIEQLIHDSNHFFKPLLERISSENKNDVNNRISNAFKTYGRVIHENSEAQKFVMYITAIESLISYDCPNLSEMISNYLAAIISKNLEEFEISKSHFKKIYSIRSDISHGTITDVLGGDLLYAKWYTMDLIKKYITDREIEHFTKNKDLKAHLESKVVKLRVMSTK